MKISHDTHHPSTGTSAGCQQDAYDLDVEIKEQFTNTDPKQKTGASQRTCNYQCCPTLTCNSIKCRAIK